MKVTHARNATMVFEVPGQRILIDPMLSAKGAVDGFPNSATPVRNPLVDLTVPLADLLDVDVVVVSHTHIDHWDAAASALLRRDLPILVQHDGDAELISAAGFEDVRILRDSLTVGDTTFTRTDGTHGTEAVAAAWAPIMGEVMGFVISHPGEPTVYVAGDTIFNDEVRTALDAHRPDVVVLNTGEARVPEGPLIMGAQDVVDVHAAAPQAKIIAVHMEALNHCTVTREQVRSTVAEHDFSDLVIVPEDGDTFEV